MRTIQVLTDARALIALPQNWIQGHLWNGDGGFCACGALVEQVGYQDSTDAARALFVAMNPAQKDRAEAYMRRVAADQDVPFTEDQLLAAFNNTGTHEEVLDLFDRAIARQLVIDSMQDPVIEISAPVYLEDIMQRADKAALLVGV